MCLQMSRLALRSTWQSYLIKKWILGALACAHLSVFSLEINQANEAELDSIKGIGPAMSGKILDERKKNNFKDWPDFISRVKGVGEATAAKLSGEGLNINGTPYKAATPAAAAPAAAPAAKVEPAKPAASAAKK
jgi:competence protein ComEA